MVNLVLLGAPGSGKGTQAERLKKDKLFLKISTGDELRNAVAEKTEIGIKAKAYMDQGQLVPDQVMIDIIRDIILKRNLKSGIILDGFPRTINQAFALDDMFAEFGMVIDAVIELRVSDEDLISRITERFSCASCGEGYNKISKPTKVDGFCDECGSTEFTFRKDDNVEVLTKRLKVYHEQTTPLVDFYIKKGTLHVIDGTMPIDFVSKQVDNIVKEGKNRQLASR
jgi:adenylate kinase